ncbi:DNA polymerase III subunit epsilon [Candidatus Vidania fulgoroideae]|uniref:DNA polymerase III subunit epsilon n=1 Tax=Candidatus Vidania fulgoroideorum TaxID=881286 RepID=A0A974X9W9_9PROT|nr:DNA polymerase III subunit epsilon [Candidatus Vidania fulgoroideae]
METYKRFLVLDTETTGLKPDRGDRIIEIALIEIFKGRITGNRFHSYFNTNVIITKKNYRIHGISNKFLLKKPKFMEKSEEILSFIGDSILVAHNALFDAKFLLNEYKIIGKKIKLKIIDTLRIFRKIFPGKRNNLKFLCDRYGIKIIKKHSALYDASSLALLFIELLKSKKLNKLQR